MQIIQDFIPIGRKNRPAGKNPIKYITIHNTGNSGIGSGAKSHSSYIKSDTAANLPVSWHYTVDDKLIYQHLPDAETAYHAGDGSGPGNTQSIGIEICQNNDGNLLAATENTVNLVVALCKKYNIPTSNIVQHKHWSNKGCPGMLIANKPYSWDTFISKVKTQLTEKTKEEITVDNALADGIITERDYWLGVLRGTITANPDYIKIVMDNAHNKIRLN